MGDQPGPYDVLAEWPLHIARHGLWMWRHSPGVFVTQTTVARAEVCHVDLIVRAVGEIMIQDREQLMVRGGLTIVHDWRCFTSYESVARQRLLGAMRSRPKGYIKDLCIVYKPSPFWRMAIGGANIALAFLGVSAPRVTVSLREALLASGLTNTPSAPPTWFLEL